MGIRINSSSDLTHYPAEAHDSTVPQRQIREELDGLDKATLTDTRIPAPQMEKFKLPKNRTLVHEPMRMTPSQVPHTFTHDSDVVHRLVAGMAVALAVECGLRLLTVTTRESQPLYDSLSGSFHSSTNYGNGHLIVIL